MKQQHTPYKNHAGKVNRNHDPSNVELAWPLDVVLQDVRAKRHAADKADKVSWERHWLCRRICSVTLVRLQAEVDAGPDEDDDSTRDQVLIWLDHSVFASLLVPYLPAVPVSLPVLSGVSKPIFGVAFLTKILLILIDGGEARGQV